MNQKTFLKKKSLQVKRSFSKFVNKIAKGVLLKERIGKKIEKIHKLYKIVHWRNQISLFLFRERERRERENQEKKTGGKKAAGEENKRWKRQKKFPKKCVLCNLQWENVAIALLQTRHF